MTVTLVFKQIVVGAYSFKSICGLIEGQTTFRDATASRDNLVAEAIIVLIAFGKATLDLLQFIE